MADIKWIKITTDIFDDEKVLLIESLPEADSIIVIWFKLLCLAGKQNNSGVFIMGDKIAYTDKMLSTIFRRKEATVQLALQTFEQFGMIEVIDGVITIPNWEKHQNIDSLDKIKEQTKIRVARHREKQKLLCDSNVTGNVTVTNCNATDKNRIDKIRKEKKEKKQEAAFSENQELNSAILSFIEFRKGIKKPMTDNAIKLLLKKLEGFSQNVSDQIEILNNSIVNGWTGIYELKDKKKPSIPEERKFCKPPEKKEDDLPFFS